MTFSAAAERTHVLRHEVETFLFGEAAILDEWRLDDWANLFTEDGRYVMPSTDTPDADPRVTLCLIDDDIVKIRGRVKRLKSRHAHREFPWSRTRRLITNVRITDVRDDEVDVTANFLVIRCRNTNIDQFSGRYLYTLVRSASSFAIKFRRAELDMETLGTAGSVSVIV
jgi:p-cumate 2,3-dioxygenase subunit beta